MLKKAIQCLVKLLAGALLVLVLAAVALGLVIGGAALVNRRTPSETDLSKSALLAAPTGPLTKDTTLKIVTFNIHDLYVASTHRPERMRAIAQVLCELDPDIAGLQESFIQKDRAILLEGLRDSRLTYHHYYPSGLVGSGLLTLSAFPIAETFFARYEAAGDWYKVYEGDWWAGKGGALARLELPGGAGHIDFYNTHAQAGYGNPYYDVVREAQMAQLADFINRSATGAAPAFLVGDMNCRPGAKDYQTAIEHANLVRLMSKKSSIDHIFGVRNDRYAFDVVDTVPISRRIPVPGGESGLSDHTGYMSTIRVVRPDAGDEAGK